MKTIYNQLKESPLLYLSGGSKELFHSNFLYWLGINYRQVFEQLMSRMLCISGAWPQGWTVKREYYHLDLCVTYSKDTGKTHKGCPVVRECAFLIVENKLKSLPNILQLKRYEQVFSKSDIGCSYSVLTLVKEFPDRKNIVENTRWQVHHYDELALLLEECCKNGVIRKEHQFYISDYCRYVSNLSAIAEQWTIDTGMPFLHQEPLLHELRLNDIYEKVRYAQIAALLAEKLRTVLVKDTDEERVVLGMSNIDVILRRREDADEILSFYGCPEAKPLQQIFIGCGMSHAVGLLEAKIKVSDDCCLVVQVQGNRYCHGFECEGIIKSTDRLSPDQLRFLNFEGSRLPGKEAKADSRLCRYNANFIYKSQKILPTHTIGDILNTMIADCQI